MTEAFPLRRVIVAMAEAMRAHAEALTALDQAIGDGDHGSNMRRGFDAVAADADAIVAQPLPDALGAVGRKLVMTVGGASGPLFGTFFMALGKALPLDADRSALAAAMDAAVQAVMARGKAHPGQKTLLDVLLPVQAALAEGGADLLDRLPVVASDAADATIPLLATRGRASFLGPRSIGHMDPGAHSTALLVTVVCATLKDPS
jgi:dihydroxyacetone kinase-like protein